MPFSMEKKVGKHCKHWTEQWCTWFWRCHYISECREMERACV